MSSSQEPGVSRTFREGKVWQLGRVTYREAVIGLVEVLPETVMCSFSADSVCCYQIFLKPIGTGSTFSASVTHTNIHKTHSPLEEPQRNVRTKKYGRLTKHPRSPLRSLHLSIFTISDAPCLTLICFSHTELTCSRTFKLTSL